MALLDDFKIKTGSTKADTYLAEYYITPAIDIASTYCFNPNESTISLTDNVQEYDLTDASIASPVITNGIVELIFDDEFTTAYDYKVDFFIVDKTTLRFISPDIVSTNDFRIRYNEFYSEATLPSQIKPAVLRLASSMYSRDLVIDNAEGNTYESKSEYNLSVSNGSIDNRLTGLNNAGMQAIQEIKAFGALQKSSYFSFQVI